MTTPQQVYLTGAIAGAAIAVVSLYVSRHDLNTPKERALVILVAYAVLWPLLAAVVFYCGMREILKHAKRVVRWM